MIIINAYEIHCYDVSIYSVFSTCNPRISSMDWSASTVVVGAFDVWGVGSLIRRRNYYSHISTLIATDKNHKSSITTP